MQTLFPIHIPPKSQLLKWIGNKQKMASEIVKHFPDTYGTFYEPFLGSGAITATLSPRRGIGSDIFKPLMDIWTQLKDDPNELVNWYGERRERIGIETKEDVYKSVLQSFNTQQNGADFLFLSRACYGGIIRFRKKDGYMSTPCGAHTPIPVEKFRRNVEEWQSRMRNVSFHNVDYKEMFDNAKCGDLIYCDPPYSHSQSILYGAQSFDLNTLFTKIDEAKSKGVRVALSIDGTKKSGAMICDISIPKGLFENELNISVGGSMLKRFQIEGRELINENVSDRLLLTY
ncbi:MAG: Dam family site-specific DNA-(adenine-N6)-methyltransferase [Rikenellaceae bacterium]